MERADNLISRSFNAMSWSYCGTAVNVALQVAASVLFARTLGPGITGVFAFGLLMFPPFRFLCEFGFGSALVQKPVLDDEDIQKAMSRSAVLAVATAAAWLLCVKALAASIHQEQYGSALNCFALVLLSLPVQTIYTAVLSKQLDQKYLQVSALIAYGVGYLGVGAFGAWHGWGVWSLVLGFVAQNLMATALLVGHTRVNLRLNFKGDANFLWRFGWRAAAINISNWLTSSLDNMAVAWFFGTKTLGLYSVAYSLVRVPADKLVSTLQNVLFPASVLAREDNARLVKGSIAALDAVFLLTAPVFFAVAALADTIVQALYGPAWHQAAWVLPPFAFSMILHCLIVVISALLWGSGGVNRDLRIQWLSASALLAAVIVAAKFSFVAVAWTVLPVTGFRAISGLVALSKILGIETRRMLRPFLGGTAMVMILTPGLIMLDSHLRSEAASALMRLECEIPAAGTVWIIAISLLHKRLMTQELQSGLRSLRSALRTR